MKTLDLHNVRHSDVEKKFMEFISHRNADHVPFRIITGKSKRMHNLVVELLKKNEYEWRYDGFINVGALIITDKPFPEPS